jgi:hypothetical protein
MKRFFRAPYKRITKMFLAGTLAFICCFMLAWSGSGDGDEVVLRVTPPQVRSVSDQIIVALSAQNAFAPGLVTAIRDGSGSALATDENGSGSPGSSGTIMVEGIGLAGATAITFEGEGISGSIILTTSTDLNPPLLVNVRIDPSAPLGPRQFKIATPRGMISSGDVALVITEPTIRSIHDQEGAPGTRGLVQITGVGLAEATGVRFGDSGVTGTIQPQRPAPLLNPPVSVLLNIDRSARLGDDTFVVQIPHQEVDSGDVKFRVVAPRIDSILEGSHLGVQFIPNGEGAPGTSGGAFIFGIGLAGASAIRFSGAGITSQAVHKWSGDSSSLLGKRSEIHLRQIPGTMAMPGKLEQRRWSAPAEPGDGVLNPSIGVFLKIEPTAPLGPQTFTLDIPRAPGSVSSADGNVLFNVSPARVVSIQDAEAVPGACGQVTINGVGLPGSTGIRFPRSSGVSGSIVSAGGTLLNPQIKARLEIHRAAPLGQYPFTLDTPRGLVQSGDIAFSVTRPRIQKINTAGGFFTILDVPDAAAPGTSGMATIQGIGLINVTSVIFSGSGVSATVEPFLLSGEVLNPGILMQLRLSDSAELGQRTITLIMNSLGQGCK